MSKFIVETTTSEIFEALTTGKFRKITTVEYHGLCGCTDRARIWENGNELVVLDFEDDRMILQVMVGDGDCAELNMYTGAVNWL